MRIRWTDENWLMLMQIFLKKPAGVKPLYSRDIVDLALRLHFSPKYIYRKMFSLRRLETPQIERLWNTYSKHPEKLAKEVNLLKTMEGFNNAESFYEGVTVNETFETDFRPLPGHDHLTPIMLVMILDLYFRLTPNTMVPETPEIKALAKTIRTTPELITEVMAAFQHYDPYLHKKPEAPEWLLEPCRTIWQRYGNDDPDNLAAFAAQLHEYFK